MTAPASGEASPVEAAAARYPHRDPLLEGGQYLAEERSRQPLREAFIEGWKARETSLVAGDWLERVLGEHADFTYVNDGIDGGHFRCDCGHAFGYEDGAHAEWEAHLAAAIRAAAGVGL